MAEYNKESGTTDTLFTYTACDDYKQAIIQISTWVSIFDVISAHIDVFDDNNENKIDTVDVNIEREINILNIFTLWEKDAFGKDYFKYKDTVSYKTADENGQLVLVIISDNFGIGHFIGKGGNLLHKYEQVFKTNGYNIVIRFKEKINN